MWEPVKISKPLLACRWLQRHEHVPPTKTDSDQQNRPGDLYAHVQNEVLITEFHWSFRMLVTQHYGELDSWYIPFAHYFSDFRKAPILSHVSLCSCCSLCQEHSPPIHLQPTATHFDPQLTASLFSNITVSGDMSRHFPSPRPWLLTIFSAHFMSPSFSCFWSTYLVRTVRVEILAYFIHYYSPRPRIVPGTENTHSLICGVSVRMSVNSSENSGDDERI